MSTIEVYTKDNCAQCRMTIKALQSAGVAYKLRDATEELNMSYITEELGHRAAPVVTITGSAAENGEFQDWSGFQPDRVKAVAERMQSEESDTSVDADTESLEREQEVIADSGTPATPEVGSRTWFLDQVRADRDLSNRSFANLTADPVEMTFGSSEIDGRVFTGADFSTSNLTGVTFNRCDLEQADMTRSDCTLAQFWGTDVGGVDFQGADLTGADLSPALNVDQIYSLEDTLLNRANLTGVHFEKQAIGGASFRDSLLGLSTFKDVILYSANMPGVDLTGASFNRVDAQLVNLNGATGLGFRDRGSDLREASFERSDFGGSFFDRSNLDKSSWQHAGLAGSRFIATDMESANFAYCEMQGANIGADCHLGASTFTGARLTGASARGVQANSAMFDGADLRGMDFRGANLTDSSFRNADCRGTIFSESDLSKADFTGARIDGAKMDDAVLDGAVGLTPSSSDNAPDKVLRGLYAHTLDDALSSIGSSESSGTSASTPTASPSPAASPSTSLDSGPSL